MKILFDADIFARCYENKKIKSGIFYSYKAILNNILQVKDVEVTLVSFLSDPSHAKIILEEYGINADIINCRSKISIAINTTKQICKDFRVLKKQKS